VEAVEELHDTLTDGSAGTAARANYFDRFPDKDLDRLSGRPRKLLGSWGERRRVAAEVMRF